MRRTLRALAATIVTATVALSFPTSASAIDNPVDVVVQAGTTIRDSGLWANVILPGFTAAFPQYTLKGVFVGTTQALINAENGQGDAVWTHNPPAEQDFIDKGYSYEPYGRYTM